MSKTFLALLLLVALPLVFFGCKPPEPPTPTKLPSPMPPTEKPKAEGVSITWFGQSSFLCQDAEGTSVLIDPFDLRVGYPDPGLHETEVDVMLITHEHFDHNNTKLVKTAANIVRGSGLHQANRVLVKGIASSHGPNGGGTPNTIFTWELGGIKFCHLGDLGVLLSEEQISQIGPVDVLFIPVGGYYTIDSAQATQVVEALKPKVVIPMHYRTPALASSIANMLATADVFLQGKEQHPDSGKHTVTLSKETLPKTTQVLAMAYQ